MGDTIIGKQEFLDMLHRWARSRGMDISAQQEDAVGRAYDQFEGQVKHSFMPTKDKATATLILSDVSYGGDDQVGAMRSPAQIFQQTKGGDVYVKRIGDDTTKLKKRLRERMNHGARISPEDQDLPGDWTLYANKGLSQQAGQLGADLIYSSMVKSGMLRKGASRDEKDELQYSLQNLMVRFEHRRRASYIRAFVQKFPQKLVRIMGRQLEKDGVTYNWLRGSDDGQVARNRLQISQNSPLVVPFVMGHGVDIKKDNGFSFSPDKEQRGVISKRLSAAVDGQEKLTDVVIDLFQVGGAEFAKAMAKRFFKMRWRDIPKSAQKNVFVLFQAMAHLPPSWYPSTKQEWKDFDTCVQNFHQLAKYTGRPMADCLKDFRGNWAEAAQLIKDHGAMHDVQDWIKAVQDKVVVPYIMNQQGKNVQSAQELAGIVLFNAKPGVFRSIKTSDVLRASIRWHDQIGAFNNKISSLSLPTSDEEGGKQISWLPLSDVMQAPNGLYLKPLTTPHQLQAQGDAQKHCVGGYSPGCLYSASHIISIYEDDPADPLLTVQLSDAEDQTKPGSRKLSVIQKQGYERRAAKQDEKAALDWYLAQLRTKQHEPDWAAIIASREQAQLFRDTNEGILTLGFDPKDPDAVQEVFRIIRPYLPTNSQRNMTYEQWMQRTGIGPFLNPDTYPEVAEPKRDRFPRQQPA